jgi:hypothetical protein
MSDYVTHDQIIQKLKSDEFYIVDTCENIKKTYILPNFKLVDKIFQMLIIVKIYDIL